MNTLAIIIVAFCAAASLLTVLALLKDSNDSLEQIIAGGIQARTAWRAYRRGGLAAVDKDSLAAATRPLIRLAVLLLILGASGAVLLVTFDTDRRPSIWTALLLAGLTAHLAIQVPCSWARYVFIGDRRKAATTSSYTGQERRRHAE